MTDPDGVAGKPSARAARDSPGWSALAHDLEPIENRNTSLMRLLGNHYLAMLLFRLIRLHNWLRKTWKYWVSGISVVSLAIIIVIGIALGKGPEWWAAWGQWVGGIGAIFAGLVAIWIATEGWKRSEKDSLKNSTNYTAWVEAGEDGELRGYHLNASKGPVYSPVLEVSMGGLAYELVRIRLKTVGPMTSPAELPKLSLAAKELSEKRKGARNVEVRSSDPTGEMIRNLRKSLLDASVDIEIKITFFHGGQGWVLTPEGKLR